MYTSNKSSNFYFLEIIQNNNRSNVRSVAFPENLLDKRHTTYGLTVTQSLALQSVILLAQFDYTEPWLRKMDCTGADKNI